MEAFLLPQYKARLSPVAPVASIIVVTVCVAASAEYLQL